MTKKFDVKKLETYRYIVWCQTCFDKLTYRLGVDHECDGQTDRQTEWSLAVGRSYTDAR